MYLFTPGKKTTYTGQLANERPRTQIARKSTTFPTCIQFLRGLVK